MHLHFYIPSILQWLIKAPYTNHIHPFTHTPPHTQAHTLQAGAVMLDAILLISSCNCTLWVVFFIGTWNRTCISSVNVSFRRGYCSSAQPCVDFIVSPSNKSVRGAISAESTFFLKLPHPQNLIINKPPHCGCLTKIGQLSPPHCC